MAIHDPAAQSAQDRLAQSPSTQVQPAQDQPAQDRLAQFTDAALNCRDDEAETLSQSLTSSDASALLELVSDSKYLDVQWWAIRGLAICGDDQAAEKLTHWLSDPEPEIRAVTVLTIGHIGQRLHGQQLNNTSTDADPSAGWNDTQPALLRAMADLLSDSEGSVRQAAADALVLLGGQAVPTLQNVLTNDTENARVRAAYALRKIGTRGDAVQEAAPALFQILNDSNYLVHTYAHEALDEMGLLDNVLVVL